MMIKIAEQFSDVPAGRYLADGPFSGERFREELLVSSLMNNEKVEIDLDGAEGYGSSFLEEAFGGLVRKGYFTATQLRNKLTIKSKDPSYRIYEVAIWRHIDKAKPENRK